MTTIASSNWISYGRPEDALLRSFYEENIHTRAESKVISAFRILPKFLNSSPPEIMHFPDRLPPATEQGEVKRAHS